MMTISDVPPDILTAPWPQRLAFFDAKLVAHPHLKATHQALLHALHHPSGTALIFVIGPTGVGKTTLRQRMKQHLLYAAQERMQRDPGWLPLVSVEVAAPESGTFNWKDYYLRVLQAMDEPLIADKRADGHGPPLPPPRRTATTADLRRALESALRHRQPQAVLVDEAQHFKCLASGRRLLDQMETIKSLANLSDTLHVLFGTYDLRTLTNLNGQLSRRSLEVHFPRYHLEQTTEAQQFQRLLWTFQRQLPVAEPPDLVGATEACYLQCLGCVGILKQWLTRALAAALEDGLPTIPWSYLDRAALGTHQRVVLSRELHAGEALFQTTAAQDAELRRLLGGTPQSRAVPPTNASDTASPTTPRPGPVGHRKPERDPVDPRS